MEAVEEVLDACHALMNQGVNRYMRPSVISAEMEKNQARERAEYIQRNINDLWRTVPTRKEDPDKRENVFPGNRKKTSSTLLKKCAAAQDLATGSDSNCSENSPVFLPSAANTGHERRLGQLLAFYANA